MLKNKCEAKVLTEEEIMAKENRKALRKQRLHNMKWDIIKILSGAAVGAAVGAGGMYYYEEKVKYAVDDEEVNETEVNDDEYRFTNESEQE